MSETELTLALDQGGHATRAVVFDARGEVVAKELVEVHETRPAPEHVEQDPEELVRSLVKAIRAATKRLGRRAEQITRAGLATQRASALAWNRRTGAALTPVLSWQDRRASARVEALSEHALDVRAKTGLRLSPHYGASKLAWCLEHVPAVRAAAQAGELALGPLSSFLTQRLTLEHTLCADPANASRTLLLNVASGAWDASLCDLFGVPLAALPAAVPTRAAFGTIDTGKGQVRLEIVTGDQSAALFAHGEPRADTLYVNFGTGAFVQRPFEALALDAPRLLKSIVRRDERGTLCVLEGTINGAGSALAWIAEREGLKDAIVDLDEWMKRESAPPLFLNGISGLAAPFWLPNFESRFVGAEASTREARVVAVLESVVFLVRAILDEMGSVLPRPARIVASGGLARLDGLCQRLADLTALRVERSAETEATATGLAWLVSGHSSEQALGDDFEPLHDASVDERYARTMTALR